MKGTILTIAPDGTEKLRAVFGAPTLELLKDGIGGGSIEVVPYFNEVQYDDKLHSCVAFCDEDGKNEGKAPNPTATMRWQAALLSSDRSLIGVDGRMLDYLVGQVAIVWGDHEFMEAL